MSLFGMPLSYFKMSLHATSKSQSNRDVEVDWDKQKKPVLSLSRVNRGDEKNAGGTLGSHALSQH